MSTRYHRILGVPSGASKEEIKRAYRSKVKLCHPDVNKSPNAADQFHRLTEAYEYLVDGRIPESLRAQARKAANDITAEPKKAHPDSRYRPAEDPAARRKARNDQLLKDGLEYYKKYKRSNKRRFSNVVAIISILLCVVFFLDFTLPFDEEKFLIERMYFERKKPSFRDGESSFSYFLEYNQGEVQEVAAATWDVLNPGDAVIFKTTQISGTFLEMDKIEMGYKSTFAVDHVLARYFWFMVILLLLPLMRYWLDRPHVSFYFFEFAIRTGIVVVVAFMVWQLFF